MPESSASSRRNEGIERAERSVARSDSRLSETPVGKRARAAWILLAVAVLVGVALFLRYGAAVIPLIREAR